MPLLLGLLFLNNAIAQDSRRVKSTPRTITKDTKPLSKTIPKTVAPVDNELGPFLFEDDSVSITLEAADLPVSFFYAPNFKPQFIENFFVSDFAPRFSGAGPIVVVFPPINIRWETFSTVPVLIPAVLRNR